MPETSGSTNSDTPEAAVGSLMDTLASPDGHVRQIGRRALVAMGKAAVPGLIEALKDASWIVRWEAAKALGETGDPRAGAALVAALSDERFGIQWLAAEGLIALGRAGLEPILEALIEDPDSPLLRDGAHHVLRYLADRDFYESIAPVVEALESWEPPSIIMSSASAALQALGRETTSGRPAKRHRQ
jgi:HEAT repeat protein